MIRRDVVYFTTDEKYIDLTTVAILSLQFQQCTKDILVFTTSDIVKQKMDSIHSNVRTIVLPKYTIGFKGSVAYSSDVADSMSCRIVAFDYLKQHYDRALYMDSDVFVQKNIDHLFDMDLEGYDMAACRDTQYLNSYSVIGKVELNRRAKLCGEAHNYINSGMMLINLPELYVPAPEEIVEVSKILEESDWFLPDQDYISHKYNIKYINSTYNKTFELYYQYYMTPEEMRTHYLMVENAHVVHYILGTKPYNIFSDAMYRMVPIERYLRFVMVFKRYFSPEFVKKCKDALSRLNAINIRIPVRVKNEQHRLELQSCFRGLI